MKTLYMHLGTPKTATSSIQVACAKNTELLHQHGYSFPLFPCTYPRVRKQRNGHFLIEASLMSDAIPDRENTWQDRLELGLNMIREEFEKYDKVILTDESLWRSLNYNQQNPLALLQKDARAYGYCIKAVVYLRRQDLFLISRWNQAVKGGIMTASAASNLNKMITKEPLVTDYAAALDRLAAQIGKENIIVRRFDPSSWVDGSIYADFSDAIGLPSGVVLQSLTNQVNPGLKGNAVDIQLSINRLPALTQEDRDYFANFTKEISADMPKDDQYNPLSPSETAEFLSRFEAGNARVAREYIKDGKPLFQMDIQDVPKWSPNDPYYMEDLTRFLSMLPQEKKTLLLTAAVSGLTAKYDEINTLRKDYRQLEKSYTELSREVASIKTLLKHPLKTAGQKFMGKK